jgi:threonine dehydrogenase-like Zn-dependent dehydrogenase
MSSLGRTVWGAGDAREEGALVEPLAVSVNAVRRGQMQGGETVVVLGAGNIGLTTVAAARALGAGKILVTARHPLQTDMSKRLGADAVLPTDRAVQIKLAIDPRMQAVTMVDILTRLTGSPRTWVYSSSILVVSSSRGSRRYRQKMYGKQKRGLKNERILLANYNFVRPRFRLPDQRGI